MAGNVCSLECSQLLSGIKPRQTKLKLFCPPEINDSQRKVLGFLKGTSAKLADPDESDSDEFTEHSPGTCDWVLQDLNYRHWEESSSSAGLWLSGSPGTGKTVISKFIVQTLKGTKKPGYHPVYASVFCHQGGITDLLVLRSILYQILIQDSSLFQYIEYRIEKIVSSAKEMWSVLKDMIMVMKESLFLVIDGVDELTETKRGRLLAGLQDLMQTARSKGSCFNERGARLKILISSRPHNDIEDSIRAVPEMHSLLLHDNEGHVNADIRKFASDRINVFIKKNLFSISPQDKREIEDALVEGANGMFLWASLAWSTFIRTDYQESVRGSGQRQSKAESRLDKDELNIDGMRKRLELLKNLPKGLDKLYSNMLQDIPGGCIDDAKTIFRCLLAATRPLAVTELTVVLNLKKQSQWCSSSKEVTQNARNINWEDRIKLSCGLFVSIKNDNTVRLIHQTVREFFTLQHSTDNSHLTQLPDPVPEWKFGFDEVHKHLGTFCLTYLSFEELAVGPLKAEFDDKLQAELQLECEEGFRTRITEFPFIEYASVYWPHHIRHTAKTGEILEIFERFKASCQRMNLAFQIFWFSEGCGGSFPSKMLPLHIICYYGLDTLIGRITPNDLHAVDIHERTPLHWAVINGHLDTVQKLLALSGDLSPGPSGAATSSLLHFAADRGHTKLVQLFLERGFDLSVIDEELGSPLQAAAYNGHLDVVRLLLDTGANINAQAGELGTALQVAAYGGHLDLVKLLLDSGADIKANSEESTFQNALQAALGEPLVTRVAGNENHEYEIIQLLLSKGAEVNASGGLYGDALQAAATHGKRDAVKLLLDHHASVTNRGGNSGSALQAAAIGGHLPVVLLLLKPIDRVDSQRDILDSAIEMATENGYETVAEVLKNATESDVNAKSLYQGRGPPHSMDDQVDAMDKVVKWGVWSFKRLVKGGRKKEADIIVKSVEKTFEVAITTRNRALVQRISCAGAEALQAVIRIPDDRMVRRLVEIGLSVLQVAIREYNEAKEGSTKVEAKVIVKNMSKIWIVALESAIEGKQRSVIETVMNSTANQFKIVLGQADEKYAEAKGSLEPMREAAEKEAEGKKIDAITLSQAAVELFLAAVLGGKHEMVDCLGSVVAKALDGALEGTSKSRTTLVESLVTARAAEFEDALDRGLDDEAEALSKAGLATLLAAVELGSQDLVKIVSKIWARVLHSSLQKGHCKIVPALVSARASAFKKAVDDENEAKENDRIEDRVKATAKVKALSEAGLAILLAAVENKCGELVDSMSGIWATVLGSASEGGNMKNIKDLVTNRADAFKKAILEIRDDDSEVISDAELSEVKKPSAAFSEAEALSEVGLAILLASIEIGHTSLAETISSIWVDALNTAVVGRRSKVMRGLVESRAAAFQAAIGAGFQKKVLALLNVAVGLSEAAADAGMIQLVHILTEIWLSALHSVIDGNNINLVETIANDRATAFVTAVKGSKTKADMVLLVGLELILASITHSKGSVVMVGVLSKIWVTALQTVVDQGYDIVERLVEFRKVAGRLVIDAGGWAEAGMEAESGISKVGLVLLLAAVEGSMKDMMDIFFVAWGSSLDSADEGKHSGVVKKFVESKGRTYLSMQRGKNEEARGVVEAVTNGDYGAAAQRLVAEATRKRRIGRFSRLA